MNEKPYWFAAKSPGWGMGLPLVWQGWVVLGALFALLIGGIMLLTPYGPLVVIGYGCVMALVSLAIGLWKGEPQRRKDRSRT